MAHVNEAALVLLVEMLKRGGVREWDDPTYREAATAAALEMAEALGEGSMATKYLKLTTGTPLTLRSSGGTAVITLASLANTNGTSTGARQAATLDLGATWAQRWKINSDFELAATPTHGNLISFYGAFGSVTGAGGGNTTGSDAAYTGYSNNNLATLQAHLRFLGYHTSTVQATTTVQKDRKDNIFTPTGRYLNLVVYNASGAAFHSDDGNCVITLTPLEQPLQDTV